MFGKEQKAPLILNWVEDATWFSTKPLEKKKLPCQGTPDRTAVYRRPTSLLSGSWKPNKICKGISNAANAAVCTAVPQMTHYSLSHRKSHALIPVLRIHILIDEKFRRKL